MEPLLILSCGSLAGAGVGGTPRGRSGGCEQRETRPTVTPRKPRPPVAWDGPMEASSSRTLTPGRALGRTHGHFYDRHTPHPRSPLLLAA